ncbi:hypothetical protein T4D_4816 [Trichinella pseudospiralis]|uniref:Uncharacterized protein n=1 Tax=Trichinella pseudospiralis TaxID=6337 RepID=A0A0V1FW63_TRIPS|nr:hypothetical protein T4D_4816 [Trichinella pseudospiralis]
MPTSGYDEFAAIAVQSGPKWRISDSTTELLITSCSATISGLVYSMCLAIFINPFSTFIPLFQILKVSTVIFPSSAVLIFEHFNIAASPAIDPLLVAHLHGSC